MTARLALGDEEDGRAELEARWLHLTRVALPAAASPRGWPVRFDHCFQRVLLDAACGGRWYDHVAGRPAYRRCDVAILVRAVALAEAALDGRADLGDLDRRSLAWRAAGPHSVGNSQRTASTDQRVAGPSAGTGA